jgi:hypothetical protein
MELILRALGIAVVCGIAAWAVTRRDIGNARAAGVGAAAGPVTAAASVFTIYLAPLALAGGLVVYVLARHRVRTSQALLAGAGSWIAFTAGGVVLISIALQTM